MYTAIVTWQARLLPSCVAHPEETGVEVLRASPRWNCPRGLPWLHFLVIIVFMIGTPVLVSSTLKKYKNALNPLPLNDDTTAPRDAETLGLTAWAYVRRACDYGAPDHLSLFWVGYKPQYWWWEVYEMVRKFLLLAVPLFLRTLAHNPDVGQVVALGWGTVVAIVTAFAHMAYSPHIYKADRWLALLSHLVIVLTLICNMMQQLGRFSVLEVKASEMEHHVYRWQPQAEDYGVCGAVVARATAGVRILDPDPHAVTMFTSLIQLGSTIPALLIFFLSISLPRFFNRFAAKKQIKAWLHGMKAVESPVDGKLTSEELGELVSLVSADEHLSMAMQEPDRLWDAIARTAGSAARAPSPIDRKSRDNRSPARGRRILRQASGRGGDSSGEGGEGHGSGSKWHGQADRFAASMRKSLTSMGLGELADNRQRRIV